MCESEPVILSAVIVLLTVIILLLVYLLTEKFCLWESNSSSLPDTKISSIYVTNSQRATRHPSQLNDKSFRVRHILCRRTPPPPKLNFPLINFGVINILWISARPPSRGQWYYGLIELEVTFLKILHLRLGRTTKFHQQSPAFQFIWSSTQLLHVDYTLHS